MPNGTFNNLQTDNLQVLEDASVGGQLDVGDKLNIGPGNITFAGVPVESGKGFLLKPQTAPTASSEGAILFLDSSTRKVTLRLAVSDGGGLVPLH